ncbi:hypothetical protein C8R48DRAFT_667271 [Suillus tomentosus]|nr:hypothetical protein C8R48DRAFT_667271 [Suillus tomentosus]
MGITFGYEMQSAENNCFSRRAISQNPYVREAWSTPQSMVSDCLAQTGEKEPRSSQSIRLRRRPQATSLLHPEVQAKSSPKLTLLYYPWRHAKLEPRNTTITGIPHTTSSNHYLLGDEKLRRGQVTEFGSKHERTDARLWARQRMLPTKDKERRVNFGQVLYEKAKSVNNRGIEAYNWDSDVRSKITTDRAALTLLPAISCNRSAKPLAYANF